MGHVNGLEEIQRKGKQTSLFYLPMAGRKVKLNITQMFQGAHN